MPQSVQFSAECPRCGSERQQPALDAAELLALLDTGADVDAYCSSCDVTWNISTEERADLARTLVSSS